MPRALPAIAVALLLAATPAAADEPTPPPGEDRPLDERTGELLRDAFDELRRSMEDLLERIPQYGVPEVTPEGDIFIPRRNPPAAPGEEGEDPVET